MIFRQWGAKKIQVENEAQWKFALFLTLCEAPHLSGISNEIQLKHLKAAVILLRARPQDSVAQME